MRTIAFRTTWLLVSILFAVSCAHAQDGERITSFHSDITVNADASMQVVETISVISTGVSIIHGIYREFPTSYPGKSGKIYHVGFSMVDAKRDGQQEMYRLEKRSNGVRIYLGDAKILLIPGDHTYILTYNTNRQLGFFPDHDELYWNVTGNGWIIPIDEASATVTLPANIPAKQLDISAYTGSIGSKSGNVKARIDAQGHAKFITTKPLGIHDGLTIVAAFPKGYLHPATTSWLTTNKTLIFALCSILFLIIYYVIAWYYVGRDPKKGIIIPLYSPPQKLSPASVRYIWKMKSDDKAFAAAIINLAVKGYVTIREEDAVYLIKRVDDPHSAAPQTSENKPTPEEQVLLDTLLQLPTIALNNESYLTFQSARDQLSKSLQFQMGGGALFSTNAIYSWIGVLLSVALAAFVIALTLAPDAIEPFQITMPSFMQGNILGAYLIGTICAVADGGLLLGVVLPAFFNYTSLNTLTLRGGMLNGGLLLFFSLPFALAGLYITMTASATYFIFLLCAMLVNGIFIPLLRAYTFSGRRLLDSIEGFRLYLSVAEVDRLQSLAPPAKTPELFESFLPFALALDVEQQWSEQFSSILASAGVDGRPYQPSWYYGSTWHNNGPTGFASALGNGFTSAISSSATAPGSSSGSGGGGFSGGGGGGGGGGGW